MRHLRSPRLKSALRLATGAASLIDSAPISISRSIRGRVFELAASPDFTSGIPLTQSTNNDALCASCLVRFEYFPADVSRRCHGSDIAQTRDSGIWRDVRRTPNIQLVPGESDVRKELR